MKSCIAALTCSLIFAHFANAQPAEPKGPPPTFLVVESTKPDKGTIVMRQIVVKYVPKEVNVPIVKDGVTMFVKKTIYEAVFVEEQHTRDASNDRVITPDGKQLPIDEVWKRLKKGTVVAFSGDNNTPAPAYLRALSADTLIIIPAPAKAIDPNK